MTIVLSAPPDLMTLKHARERLGWTQARLAAASRISNSTISRIELGGSGAITTYVVADALADALGVSRVDIHWPFGLTEYNSHHAKLKHNSPSDPADEFCKKKSCTSCFVELHATATDLCDYCS